MKILKWFFHPLLILVVIIAVAVYFNRDDLLSTIEKLKASYSESTEQQARDSKTDSAESSVSIPEEQLSAVETEPAAEATVAVESAPEEKPLAVEKTETPVESVVDEQPSQTVADDSAQKDMAPSIEEQPVIEEQPAEQEPETAIAQSPEAEKSEDVTVADGSAQSSDSETTSARIDSPEAESVPLSGEELQRLQYEANRATFQRNFAEAESAYLKIIESHPHNFDAYGSLGDVYMRMGDVDRAVEAYSNAAELLYRSNRKNMAWRVIDYIGRISPEKARELRSRLNER